MSKLDRELKAIIDEMGESAKQLVPKLLAVMVDDDLGEDEQLAKFETIMQDVKPKTYDVYIADIKQVFREAGWIEPKSDILPAWNNI